VVRVIGELAALEGAGDLDDDGTGALAFGVGDLGLEVQALDLAQGVGVLDHGSLGFGDHVGGGQRAGGGGIGREEGRAEREEGEEGES
jgi:hypothetical protein